MNAKAKKPKKKSAKAKAKRKAAPKTKRSRPKAGKARRRTAADGQPGLADWPSTPEDQDLWRLWNLEAEEFCWKYCGERGINWYDPGYVESQVPPPKREGEKPGPKEFEPTPEILAQIEAAAGQTGLTKEQISYGLGISPATFYRAQKVFPEIREAYKKGKALANATVASKLYNKAAGMEPVLNPMGKPTGEMKPTGKGDTTAQIFWLKARAGWRDRDGLGEDPDLDPETEPPDETPKLENTEEDAAVIIDILKEAGATEPEPAPSDSTKTP